MLREEAVFYHRVYSWWILLHCWGALRFSDHTGLGRDERFTVEGNPRFSKYEMFKNWVKLKRGEELRIDESSVQKLRESHETIQRRTSQLQTMQEQVNSMNDSGEFQEVESNHSGRLSYIPSQFEMIPSSSSMLSRDNRLPFILQLVRPEIFLKENSLWCRT